MLQTEFRKQFELILPEEMFTSHGSIVFAEKPNPEHCALLTTFKVVVEATTALYNTARNTTKRVRELKSGRLFSKIEH